MDRARRPGRPGEIDIMREHCRMITQNFMRAPLYAPFRNPVPKSVQGYAEAIKQPVCLSDIVSKLQSSGYATYGEWIDDMQLMFRNAIQFNGAESPLGLTANRGLAELKTATQAVSYTAEERSQAVAQLAEELIRLGQHGPKPVRPADVRLRPIVDGAAGSSFSARQWDPLVEHIRAEQDRPSVMSDILWIIKAVVPGFNTDGPEIVLDLQHLPAQALSALAAYFASPSDVRS